MMDLMLKQMHQQAVAPFGLYLRIAIDAHHLVETVGGQALADFDKTTIDRGLLVSKIGNRRARHRIFPRSRPKPSTLERVDVEMIDDQDVIERFLQAGEETDASSFELKLRQTLASHQ
jgi:hypothetical protein